MEGWQRTLRVLWFVQFLTTLAMNLGLTFVPFFLADDPVLRVHDPAARIMYTCLILAGPFFTTILFTPLWGWVADRTGPKRQVVRACFGLGLTQLLMAVAQSPDQMVAIRMLQGMLSGVLAASLGLLAVVTPKEQHGRAISVLQSATPAGQIFAPVLGGILATTLGFRPTYAILGSLILATGFLSWLWLRQDGFRPTSSANPFAGLCRAGREAARQPALRQAFGILLGGQFAFSVTQGVFAIYAGHIISAWVEATGAEPAWWNSPIGFTALAMTLTGSASVLGSRWWGRLHDARARYLTPSGAALLSVSMLILYLEPIWWLVLVARMGVGLGLAAMSSLPFASIASGVPAEQRGQFMGLATSLTHVGNLAGFLLGGLLAAWWGEPGNFALAALAYALVMVAGIHLERRSHPEVDRSRITLPVQRSKRPDSTTSPLLPPEAVREGIGQRNRLTGPTAKVC
ncbi:MAG: MFS transporter [Gemmataceae bacterium]